MSETESEKSPQARRLSDDFKQDAVRLVTQENDTIAAAAKAVGDDTPETEFDPPKPCNHCGEIVFWWPFAGDRH